MRRTISAQNPFYDAPRFAFGYEFIRPGQRILDYGCFDGHFGAELLKHVSVEYFGVDKNREAVMRGAETLRLFPIDRRICFEDNYFDLVTAFEVLEHIVDQRSVLREIHRVLKPNGTLVISVPRRNVLTFLDLANVKFMFPRAHRLYYSLTRSRQAYVARYQSNPHGLVGDIELGKEQHQHFRDSEMRALVEECGFKVEEMDGSGFFTALADSLGVIFYFGRFVPTRFRRWDDYRFSSRTLLCRARKVG